MKKILVVLIAILVIAVGLYGARWAYYVVKYVQHLPAKEIVVNDVKRKYHIFVPTNVPDRPLALLVLLQGGDAGSWPFAQQDRWEQLAEEEGVIIALPVGKRKGSNEGAWQLNTDAQSRQDIDYIEAMIDDISASHPIDSSKVYGVGYSLGSMFSYELACQMSTRFAAIASFAGTMPVSPKSCEPQRNVPIMHIHGVQDPIIAYGNTWDWKAWDSVGTMRDIPSLVQFWRDRYKCRNENETESESSRHIVHDSCDQNARVEHYRLETVGHWWPENIDGEPTYSVIWSFLSSFSLP